MKCKTILILLLAPIALTPSTRAASIFYFTSSPTSWVGQGQTLTLTAPTFPVRAFKYPNASANDISVLIERSPGEGWRIEFGAAGHAPLAVGSYPHASRFNIAGPGLDFSGYHRGNNELSGSFEILELALQPDGQVDKFAADFIQYDERNLTRWNIGSVRYNSDIPLTFVPEPSILALALIAFATLPLRRRNRVREHPRGIANSGA